jgi:hypothetical protein
MMNCFEKAAHKELGYGSFRQLSWFRVYQRDMKCCVEMIDA